jgi:adenosylcobinamide amidohydrolase
MDLTVTYDPAVLKYSGVKQGDLIKNGLMEAKEAEPGTVNIGFVNPAGISSDGTLFTIGFTATGAKGTSSPVTLVNRGGFTTNHLDVPATMNSGTVTVTGQNFLPVGMEAIIGALAVVVLLTGFRQKKA